MTDRPLPPKANVIPDNAKAVFVGEIFTVYQWQQEMFDGSFETFEMLKRPDTVVVIAIDEGKIVTLNEEQPGGTKRKNILPKGRVDPTDMSILEAAQRELREETGMEFSDWRLLQINQPHSKIEWFVYTFVAQKKIAQHHPSVDPGEKIEVLWSDFSTLKQTQNMLDRDIKALQQGETLEEFISGLPA